MRINEIVVHEFDYLLEDVGIDDRHHRVYDPGSTIESPGFVLTVRTADGTEGHYRGFMYTSPMIAQIKMVAEEYLLGRDPLEREGIWNDLWHRLRITDHAGLGPIDIALWDLAGHHYDESVASLLGGFRDAVPAYASTYSGDHIEGGLNGPDGYADYAHACRDAGYSAFKIHPYGDPDKDIAVCRAVTEAVGDELDLMLDPASEYETYTEALRVGRVLDELGFFWYEDPLAETGQSAYAMRRLSAELDTPLLGMEHVRTGHFGAVDHLNADALDLVRADAHLDGGITGALRIARVAEAFGIDVELHVGGPSHLHCMSAIRNTNYFEDGLLHPQVEWWGDQGFTEDVEQIDDDGMIPVPDGPGLGVEIDWAFVEDRQTAVHHIE